MPHMFVTYTGLRPICKSSGHLSALHLTCPCSFVHPRLSTQTLTVPFFPIFLRVPSGVLIPYKGIAVKYVPSFIYKIGQLMVTASSSPFYLLNLVLLLLLLFLDIQSTYAISSNPLQKLCQLLYSFRAVHRQQLPFVFSQKKYSCLDKGRSEDRISFVLKVEEDSEVRMDLEDNDLSYLP